MKYVKVLLSVCLVSLIAITIYVSTDRKSEVVAASETSVSTQESEEPFTPAVQLDAALAKGSIEDVSSTSEYLVTKDGVNYIFTFATPSNADDIISAINTAYEEDFTECVISYNTEGDMINYRVNIGADTFIINSTLD